jgi:hypothetical protein
MQVRESNGGREIAGPSRSGAREHRKRGHARQEEANWVQDLQTASKSRVW